MKVAVEIVIAGRNPVELPAHALFERLDFGDWRVRDGGERHIALREVNECGVGVIHEKRTAGAAFLPVWAEHEVIDDELAPAVEQFGQRFLATE